jgi:hypothetical protein
MSLTAEEVGALESVYVALLGKHRGALLRLR